MPLTLMPDPVSQELTTELILAEEPFLHRLARRYARQRADANDLVQETMLRAYRARDRFEPGTSVRAWLATILRRVFLTNVSRVRRRATLTNTDSDDVLDTLCQREPVPVPLEPDAQGEFSLEGIDDRIKHAFERLPPEYRLLFGYVVRDGLSYREIAARLSIPVGTVMSRMHRARQRILTSVGRRRSA